MSELKSQLESIDLESTRTTLEVNEEIARILEGSGYDIALYDYNRPWGGFNQLANSDADRFVEEFFPGLSLKEARLGSPELELSPKILMVSPGQRLSWQYHNRRAERWAYITDGSYHKSVTDEQGERRHATAGDVVQFSQSERHRLVGAMGHYTLVAEIWQHTEPTRLSNEDDIVRLADDYKR